MKIERIAPRGHRGGAAPGATQAVKAGDLVFVGGQMSLDENRHVIGDDIAVQAENAFAALARVLAEAGASMADVVKHNVYFDCEDDDAAIAAFMAEVDRVRLAHFSDPGPTATETRVGLDREGALIQVEAVAALAGTRQRLMPAGHWGWSTKVPFSHGWRVGDVVFIGGQRSLDAAGGLRGAGDIGAQTHNSFSSMERVLEEAGGDITNLLRQNTYYRFIGEGADVTDYWERMTRVRMEHMAKPGTCGTGVRVGGFGRTGELIQVEGMGVIGQQKHRLMPADHWDWSLHDDTFTQGWKAGGLVFVGGQISADAEARAVGADMATQTRNVYRFIRKVLDEAGVDESDVVKVNSYYYVDGGWDEISAAAATIAEIHEAFYPEPGPAYTGCRVTGFAFEDLLIEIEAIAVARD